MNVNGECTFSQKEKENMNNLFKTCAFTSSICRLFDSLDPIDSIFKLLIGENTFRFTETNMISFFCNPLKKRVFGNKVFYENLCTPFYGYLES